MPQLDWNTSLYNSNSHHCTFTYLQSRPGPGSYTWLQNRAPFRIIFVELVFALCWRKGKQFLRSSSCILFHNYHQRQTKALSEKHSRVHDELGYREHWITQGVGIVFNQNRWWWFRGLNQTMFDCEENRSWVCAHATCNVVNNCRINGQGGGASFCCPAVSMVVELSWVASTCRMLWSLSRGIAVEEGQLSL